jgi:hypothetical protein
MPSVADIVPRSKPVQLGGQVVEVRGIGVDTIAAVVGRSEVLRRLIETRSFEGLDPWELLRLAPEAVCYVIASATCDLEADPFDPDCDKFNAEQRAIRRLALDDQVELLATVFEVSMPGGLNPFVDRVLARFQLDRNQVQAVAATAQQRPPEPRPPLNGGLAIPGEAPSTL